MIHIQQLANLIRLTDRFSSQTGKTKSAQINVSTNLKDPKKIYLTQIKTEVAKKQTQPVPNHKSSEIQKSPHQNDLQPTNDSFKSEPILVAAPISNDHPEIVNLTNEKGFGFSSNQRRYASKRFQYSISNEERNRVLSLQLHDTLLIFRSKEADFSVMSLEIQQNSSEIGIVDLLPKLKRHGIDEVYQNGKMISGNRFA